MLLNPYRFGVSSGGGDPFFSSVESLLHFDGGNESTVFTDETGRSWTAGGGAKISTAHSIFGGASGLFNGSTDYISTPDSEDFTLGVVDFTIEIGVRFNSVGSRIQYIIEQANSDLLNTTISFGIQKNQTDKIVAFCYSGSTIIICTGTTSVVANQFYRICLQRSGTNFQLGIDGIEEASATSALSINNSAEPLVIGRAGSYDGGANLYLDAYVDEFRLTKGVARRSFPYTIDASAFPDS